MADEHRLVIAIDYGTTYTGVAFATPNKARAVLDEIDVVSEWGPQMGNHNKIPSVISYSECSRAQEQQWGASISPEAITMINTKLELDLQDNKSEELDLILQALDGMNNLHFDYVKASKNYPAYTWKGPGDIVTDYLTKLFQYISIEIRHFSPEFRALIPVDIVVTVPVKWSYRAQNATFLAVKKAGFNNLTFPNLRDIIMVTEPEAAAVYAARYLKEDAGREFLKIGECFVLCDAGGGTVDVVSYKVIQLEPTLELEAVTFATGAKCGAVYIDGAFKSWLKETIGNKNYEHFDPRNASQKISSHATEGREMRELMSQFEAYKRKFNNNHRDIKMDLPEPLDDITIAPKVVGGEMTITNEDMRSFFDPCIDQIVELVQGQILQVEKKGSRVKNIFLIGGFGESQYLQEELEQSLKLRRIQLRRPDTSWTAVVRGAVIHGIEKLDNKNLTLMRSCPRSYGIKLSQTYSGRIHDKSDTYKDSFTERTMANAQMIWLIKKGDLLLSNTMKEAEEMVTFKFWEKDSRKFGLCVYEYSDDDLPGRFQNAREELKEVALLICDFTNIPLHEFARSRAPKSSGYYYMAHGKCRMQLLNGILTIQVLWNERIMSTLSLECI